MKATIVFIKIKVCYVCMPVCGVCVCGVFVCEKEEKLRETENMYVSYMCSIYKCVYRYTWRSEEDIRCPVQSLSTLLHWDRCSPNLKVECWPAFFRNLSIPDSQNTRVTGILHRAATSGLWHVFWDPNSKVHLGSFNYGDNSLDTLCFLCPIFLFTFSKIHILYNVFYIKT